MTVIDDYIAKSRANPKEVELLEHIRQLVHVQVPDLEEIIRYGVSAFRHRPSGKVLLGFAVNKNSLAIYPFSGAVLSKLKADVSTFQSAKSALNFTTEHPHPDSVIKEIITIRIDEIA